MGPPWMMVMVPSEALLGSALDVATRANVAVVGIVVGAVYVAEFGVFEVMLPQPGLQVGLAGKGTLVFVSCVINQVTPSLFKSLLSVALKGCCSPVGTVAVDGVMAIAIPEMTENVALPVFLGSAWAVAVSFS